MPVFRFLGRKLQLRFFFDILKISQSFVFTVKLKLALEKRNSNEYSFSLSSRKPHRFFFLRPPVYARYHISYKQAILQNWVKKFQGAVVGEKNQVVFGFRMKNYIRFNVIFRFLRPNLEKNMKILKKIYYKVTKF